MATEQSIALIEKQGWLDPIGNVLQRTVSTVFSSTGRTGRKVENALHGTWLGHPVHAALVHFPIGAWTTAMVLDIAESTTGNKKLGRGADAAIAIGLASAAGAAITGLTDWHKTDSK